MNISEHLGGDLRPVQRIRKEFNDISIQRYGVWSECDVIHLFIYPQGLTLNTEACIKFFEEVVLPWLKMVSA